MSERPQKSIFAHKQTYSMKGNSKSRSVRDIAHENERLAGACPHVVRPQPPTILEGMRPSAVVDLIEGRVAAQNRILRVLREDRPDCKDALRAIRVDTHVLIASIFSFPDLVAEMDEAKYLRWQKDAIKFAREDAARNGAEVLSIIEHRDESHPHVHVLAMHICADDNMRMDANRRHEGHREQDRHRESDWSGSPSRSYKQAMRAWQDRYHADVGARDGQARTGPRRRRLDRTTWKAERDRLEAQKAASVAIERAVKEKAVAEEAHARLQDEMTLTLASMIEDAETAHMIAAEGLIATLRHRRADTRLIERLTAEPPVPMRIRRPEERVEMNRALQPVVSDGLERLRHAPEHRRATSGFAALMDQIAGWIDAMEAARPDWLQWGELSRFVAHDARAAFGLQYVPSTLAQIVERSPAWSALVAQAKSEFTRVAAVGSKLMGGVMQVGKSLFSRGT